MATEPQTRGYPSIQFEPDLFWQQHGNKIIGGAVVVLLVGLAAYFYQRNAQAQADQLATLLVQAQDLTTLENIARSQAGKPIGAQALLRLADRQFQQQQFAAAAESFEQFLRQYPRHRLAPAAALGVASALEAQGNLAAARDRYRLVIQQFPAAFTTLAARYGVARCTEALGDRQEAQRLYDELLAAARGTVWESEIHVRWMTLRRQLATAVSSSPTNAAAFGSALGAEAH